MEIRLPTEQKIQLNDLAARTGRAPNDLLQEAVARLLAQDEWIKAQIQIGIDQIQRGEFLEEEAMDEHVERMLRS